MSEANQYLLRAPFSLEKITWNQATKCVIYRSSRNWRTKRNFEIFAASDFLAAAVEHIPPKHQQTIRYYGLYSNKHRGMSPIHQWVPAGNGPNGPPLPQPPSTVPAPPASSARALRPLWRDLILRVFGTDPLECPCCRATMRVAGTVLRSEEVEFFLRLHGLWDPISGIPPPPEPPYDIETLEPVESSPSRRQHSKPGGFQFWPPDQAHEPDLWEQAAEPSPAWQALEVRLDDERVLVLDADPLPPDE